MRILLASKSIPHVPSNRLGVRRKLTGNVRRGRIDHLETILLIPRPTLIPECQIRGPRNWPASHAWVSCRHIWFLPLYHTPIGYPRYVSSRRRKIAESMNTTTAHTGSKRITTGHKSSDPTITPNIVRANLSWCFA